MRAEVTIENFIAARIEETEKMAEGVGSNLFHAVRRLCDGAREVLEFQKNWPVLSETKPELTFLDDYDHQQVNYQLSRQIVWLTQEEYVKKFGRAAPSSTLIKQMAANWSYHPDFNDDWRVDDRYPNLTKGS